jgi:hypothetical protein
VINQQNTKKKKQRGNKNPENKNQREKKRRKKKKSRETEDQLEESCSSTPVLSATRSARKSIALSLASSYTW